MTKKKKGDSACAKGATREGERKGDTARCQSGLLQTVFQGAGHGGAECAAVWLAVPFSAGLRAAHQGKKRNNRKRRVGLFTQPSSDTEITFWNLFVCLCEPHSSVYRKLYISSNILT